MLRKLGVFVILAGFLLLAAPALAGGWAVVTIDALPGEVRAGETVSIGFMVRQHGHTPTNSASPTLSAYNPETGETVRFETRQSGETGHYVADVVFPSAGQWGWSIAALGPEIEFVPLTVLPAIAQAADSAPVTGALAVREILRWTSLALMLAAGVIAIAAMRQRDVAGVPAAGA